MRPPNEWALDFGLNTFAWGEKIGEYALKHCPNGDLAVLHDPSTYGQGGLYGIEIAYNKAGKKVAIDHTITENWSTGATAGLMPEVEAIKAAGIKCVDVWLTPQDQAAFAQDLQTAGYEVTMFGNDETNADDTFSKLAGKLGDGMITAELTTDLKPSDRLVKWREDYKKRFGVDATPFAAGSYDSIMMLAQVIEEIGSTDPEALKKGFNSVKDFDGLTGKPELRRDGPPDDQRGPGHAGEVRRGQRQVGRVDGVAVTTPGAEMNGRPLGAGPFFAAGPPGIPLTSAQMSTAQGSGTSRKPLPEGTTWAKPGRCT